MCQTLVDALNSFLSADYFLESMEYVRNLWNILLRKVLWFVIYDKSAFDCGMVWRRLDAKAFYIQMITKNGCNMLG